MKALKRLKRIPLFFVLLFFVQNSFSQTQVCGRFIAPEGQGGFIDEILFKETGESMLVNKKISRKMIGTYEIKEGTIVIQTSGLSKLSFKFEKRDVIIGKGNPTIEGLRFIRNELGSKFCLKKEASPITSNTPTSGLPEQAPTPSNLIEKKKQEELPHEELCGYYEVTKVENSFYLALGFNKDETMVFKTTKRNREYKGTYKKQGKVLVLYFYGREITLVDSIREFTFVGTSGALKDKEYSLNEEKSLYCESQESVTLESSEKEEEEEEIIQPQVPKGKWGKVEFAKKLSDIDTNNDPVLKCIVEGVSLLQKVKHSTASNKFKTCCEKYKDSRSCLEHASYLDVHEEEEEAEVYYKKSCNLGYGRACFVIGRSLLQKGFKSKSISFFEKGCTFGHPKSCKFIE